MNAAEVAISAESPTTIRVPEREEEPHGDRPLSVLHELPCGVVDRRDVVGVDGVPETEGVGEEGRRQEDRVGRRGGQDERPGAEVEEDEEPVDREDPVAQGARGDDQPPGRRERR